MKTTMSGLCALLIFCLFSLCLTVNVFAEDMRSMHIKTQEARALLEKKAAAEKKSALDEAGKERKAIMDNRKLLEQKISELKSLRKKLKKNVAALTVEAAGLEKKEKKLSRQLDDAAAVVRELVGVIRINAKDINSLVEQNLQSGLFQPDTAFLDELLKNAQFPGMDDVRRMVELLKAQISETEGVVIKDGLIVGRDGHEVTARILLVGPFTAAYRQGSETGLLSYSTSGRKFYALASPPPSAIKGTLADYMDGKGDDVPVDISRGGAIRDLTSSLSFAERVRNGGPVVWPIIGVFAAGLFIIVERLLFLLKRRINSADLIAKIEQYATQGKWQRATEICDKLKVSPLANVLLAGINARDMGREDMENALQEAILSKIPAMERFLSALGMLAAIAPLLGLLGTVTGMINTFHVITQHGTGDPRLMSSGISEALVTTMLGLSTAIPLLLAHNLLGGVVERRITDMEEKAVALVNIILKTR